MNKTILALGVVLIATVLCYSVLASSSDSTDLRALQAALRKAPIIAYPEKDLKNRSIPPFDQLAVLPSCKSCSTFRMNCAAAAKENPQITFLILSLDTEQLEQFEVLNNCYIALLPKSANFAMLTPGMYNR